jgi:undecaprenyl diphosphate synthase
LEEPALSVPRHVAIIMDGNGRWATKRGLPRLSGHRAGVERIRTILQCLGKHGVQYVTLYAFSTENWSRPSEEVTGILEILGEVIEVETQALHERGVRIFHLGRTDRLPRHLKEAVERSQKLTQHNNRMTLCVAFDYGGRSEILEAVKAILKDGVPPDRIDEAAFSKYLYTSGIPDPDLIIRTGGEQRLSNFLLWQSAYSEFFSTPTNWPDLGPDDIQKAIYAYSSRQRRFGAVKPGC